MANLLSCISSLSAKTSYSKDLFKDESCENAIRVRWVWWEIQIQIHPFQIVLFQGGHQRLWWLGPWSSLSKKVIRIPREGHAVHWFISLQNSSQRILSYSGSGWVSHIPSKWWSVCRRVPVVSTVVAFHFHVVHKKLLLMVELVEFPLRCLRFDARMYLQTWIGCFKKWVSSPLLLATAEVYKTTADLVDADKADKSLPAQEKDMYRQNVVVAQRHLLL